MNRADQLKAAQIAKKHLSEQIGDQPWCSGIGLAPADGGGFALRVNVKSQNKRSAKLPKTFEGIPLIQVEIKEYRSRTTSQPPAPNTRAPKNSTPKTPTLNRNNKKNVED